MPQRWIADDHLEPRIRVNHPPTTGAGDSIRVDKDDRFGRRRIHLIAPDRSEIYFELVLYPEPLDIEHAIESQRSFLVEQDKTKSDVVFTDREDVELLGRTARRVQVEFSDKDGRFTRLFHFLNFKDAPEPWGLRVVFDPSSVVNREILGRLDVTP